MNTGKPHPLNSCSGVITPSSPCLQRRWPGRPQPSAEPLSWAQPGLLAPGGGCAERRWWPQPRAKSVSGLRRRRGQGGAGGALATKRRAVAGRKRHMRFCRGPACLVQRSARYTGMRAVTGALCRGPSAPWTGGGVLVCLEHCIAPLQRLARPTRSKQGSRVCSAASGLAYGGVRRQLAAAWTTNDAAYMVHALRWLGARCAGAGVVPRRADRRRCLLPRCDSSKWLQRPQEGAGDRLGFNVLGVQLPCETQFKAQARAHVPLTCLSGQRATRSTSTIGAAGRCCPAAALLQGGKWQ